MFDHAITNQRLARLLHWLAPTILGFSIVFGALGWRFGDWQTILGACGIGAHGLLTVIAQRQCRRQRTAYAAYLVSGGALGSLLLLATMHPALYPGLAVVPLLIATLLLQYAPPRDARYYLSACFGSTALIVVLGELAPVSTLLPAPVVKLLYISSLLAIVCFALLLLGQFSSRLQATLDRLGQAYGTLQKQHAELARLSYQHELILNSAGEGIYGIDANGVITFANQAAARMFGVTISDLVGRSIPHAGFLPSEPASAASKPGQLITAVLREGVIQHQPNEIYWRRDGTSFPVEYVSAPIFDDGTIVGAVVLFRDITERVQAQAALEAERALLARRVEERTADLIAANAELARAARLKDEFLANMSHELRTPLNAILGLSEALQEGSYEPLAEVQIRPVRIIEESGRHLLALINDILDLAKVGAGKLELDWEPVAINAICEASLQFIRQQARNKQIELITRIDRHLSEVQADPRRLKQILVNLLSNAVKFTPNGGTIQLEVLGSRDDGRIRFVVADTGIGIAPEQMGQLFQPFVQLDGRLNRQFAGTGLGLALVARLVELHGGSVEVESTPGQGSRFTVALNWDETNRLLANRVTSEHGHDLPLPAHHRAVNGAGPLSASALGEAPEQGSRILVAEDNEFNIMTIATYLQRHGYEVVVARNGVEAVELARRTLPALILMDIQMPEIDGLEATRRIRGTTDLAAIPIIAVTALAMPGDRERCLAAGADDYMSKPISVRVLRAKITALLAPTYREVQ